MPVGFRIASAWVDIRAEDKGLRQQVKDAVQKAVRGQDPKIPVHFETKGLRRELDRAIRNATRGQKPTVPIKIDSKGLRRELSDAIKRASAGQRTAVPVNIDAKGLRKEIKLRFKEALAGQTFKLPLTVDSKGLRREINRALREATSGQKPTVKLGINSSGLRSEVNRALRTAMAGQRATVPLHLNTASASNAAHNMSRLMKIVLASVLLVPPALAVLDKAIRVLGPSTAVLTSMFTALVTVGATLMVGMNGVGQAIEQSGQDAKKYAQALGYLTPAAKQFVEAVVESKGAFKDLRNEVQETLFKDMARDIRAMAKETIPSFTVGLGGMAMILNGMAHGAMNTTTSLAKMGTLKAMFGGLQLAMEPLVPIPGQIVNALVKLSTAAMPLFIRMNTAMGSWFDNMTVKLNKAFNNGTLMLAINRSGDAIVNFFRKIGSNPQWQQFVSHMKATGPEMAEIFRNLTEALLKLINNLSPISGAILKIADAMSELVLAMPDGMIKTILSIYGAFFLWGVITKIVLGVTKAVVMLNKAFLAMRSQSAMIALIGTRLTAAGATAPAIARLAAATRAVGMAAGVAAVGVAAFYVGYTVGHALWGKNAQSTDDATRALTQFGTTNKMSADQVDKLSSAFNRMAGNRSIFDKIYDVGTIHKNDEWKKAAGDIDAFDKGLAKLVQDGNLKLAAAAYDKMMHASGAGKGKFKKSMDDYNTALKDLKLANDLAAETMGVFGDKAIWVSGRLKVLKDDTDGLTQSLFALNSVNRDSISAARDWEQTADDLTKAAKAKNLVMHYTNGILTQETQAQRDAAVAMEAHAAATEKSALATYMATGDWVVANKTMTEGRQHILDAAKQMGMGKEEAIAYADAILKIPTQKEINVMVSGQAEKQLQDVAAAYKAAPEKKTIQVDALNAAAIRVLEDTGYKVTHLPNGKFEITADGVPARTELEYLEKYKIDPKTVEILARITSATIEIDKAQKKVDDLKQKKKVAVGADKKKLQAEIDKAQIALDKLKQKRAADIKALDKTGEGVASAKKSLGSVKDKTVTITSVFSDLASGPAASAADAIQRQADAARRAAGKGKRYGGAIRRASGGGVGGGFVSGPGGPTSDKIKALLSNGEYVIKASSVKKYGSGLMGAINSGRFPKYAVGGLVRGAGGASGGTGVQSTPTTGTFSVTDATGKPVASAIGNFAALQAAVAGTYGQMTKDTAGFGKNLTTGLGTASKGSSNSWSAWATGMKSRTDGTYKSLKAQTDAFGRNSVTRTTQTRTSVHNVWQGWKAGMESRTHATYQNLNTATGAFSRSSVSAIGKARDGMGAAWGGLSPKFKPPVSYLVHTVINQGVVGSMNAIMSKLGGGSKVGAISVPGFATGGAINGPGSKTSDSIMARLSNGEFVMQAKAVDKFGVGFMSQVNQGKLPKDGAGFTGFSRGGGVNISMPAFAAGGAVGVPSADTLNKIMGEGGPTDVKKMTNFIMDNYVLPLINSGSGGSAMKDVQRAGADHIRANVEKFVKENFGGAGSASAGLRWAKTQYGKPYQWGGNGNPSWDCSGFMSAIESVIRGEKPHRRWATGAFSGATAPPGWKLNAASPFKIGITNAGVGHTAGTIGRENVESSGGAGVHGGKSARGWNDPMFGSHYGFVGGKATGGPISGPGTGTSDSLLARLSNGEYVIRASSVKKYGTNFLNQVNTGNLPGFASGGYTKTRGKGSKKQYYYHGKWYSLSGYKKAKAAYDKKVAADKAAASARAEGKSKFTADMTFSHFGQMAQAQGSFRDNEFENAVGQPASISALVDSLNGYRGLIKQSTTGKTQSSLLAKLDSTGKANLKNQQKLEGVNKALDEAKDKLSGLKDSFNSLRDSVKSSIISFGSITKIGKWGTNPQTILNQLQTDVTKSGAFAGQLDALKAKGVDPALIQQIAEAGITGGGAATAASILNMSPEQLAKLNELQKQLTDNATKAGTVTADAMYGAGVRAAEGLVTGLESQKKAIESVMMAIAKSMEAAIKKALGIKSPSRLMAKVGHFTVDGLLQPINARKEEANASIRALVPASDLSRGIPRLGRGTGGVGTIESGSSRVNIGEIHVHVNGTFDLTKPQQRREIARQLVREIKEEIRLDDRKRK